MQRFHEDLALANKDNQIVVGNVRISVISDRIVRVERSFKANFVDNRTQEVYCRNFSKDKATIKQDGNIVYIAIKDRKYEIDVTTLKYKVYIGGERVKLSNKQNLKGTIRTLDGNIGFAVLPNGLMSRSGLTILEDNTGLLNEDGSISKRQDNYVDFYILAFGRDYLKSLNDFYNLSGKTPVVPKYALGNWWSRYHAYTDKEYLELMDKFKEKNIPFTVSTVDMDWHKVDSVPKDLPFDPRFGRGWTGYTFEESLFPDYKGFLKELHKRNYKIALNLHPKDGVRYFEKQYKDMCLANDVDPNSKKTIEFDLINTKFRDSYFDILHHPYEEDGVDIWWIDWQQGTKSKMEGVDPLWLLNHYHYKDINRNKRGIILSRFSGIGSQRYPLGFSGDTIVCWNSLKFQPYFTLCSTNVGYTWWSHDIGGHMLNKGDNELYLRWLQLGCFLPINRLHSTNNTLSKEPWLYKDVEQKAIDVLRFRHSLIAYCYSASIENNREGKPICTPLYYYYDEEKAYSKKFRNEYIFASNLLVAPICKPGKKGITKTKIWMPKGKWINIFDGKKYDGDKVVEIAFKLEDYPVYAKEGSFIPLIDSSSNKINYDNLLVKVFLGDGSYELLDDNGSIKFSISKKEDGYSIKAIKIGEIDTKQIEYEFVGENIENIKVELDKESEIFVK